MGHRIYDVHAPPVSVREALFHTHIVQTALAWWFRGLEMPSSLPCRRRPGHRPCRGHLRLLITDDQEPIRWRCDRCGDSGEILNWSESPDFSGYEVEGARGQQAWLEARLPAAAHERLLRSCERMSRSAVERILRAAVGAGKDVIVGAPPEAMAQLFRFISARIRRARSMETVRLLEKAQRRVGRALEGRA